LLRIYVLEELWGDQFGLAGQRFAVALTLFRALDHFFLRCLEDLSLAIEFLVRF
jgi:hypothetical protein